MSDDPEWYKDAIIYELHIKAFFDSNNDGIGDIRGLIDKLDYLQNLGVNTLWLLPFYPSPMRDDGYDISDYRNIHPDYGTRGEFRSLVREAHNRGIRIITELVINHTSDQHPWFQAARRAPPDSAKRNYYVWSDTPDKYQGTRIIFTDSETSNWTWDEVAQAYYWHRFFSHQPDLNFDNPNVVKAVIRTMRFWLDLGVDGLRLDAIPYLCERDGTNNENLPETHAIIRQIRAAIDAGYRGRMLLAEANQWPEDVLGYFGDGDECHMAYQFPLMPRLFLAIAQEDRHPITDILRQTPDIPPSCQWATFLRNHDELTLEMVSDRERDYMYRAFAIDPRMRVNVGIRRRLAPLMDNSRSKIELMLFLLLTLPGSPILYYGDEIGMGDNIYLGDRNGVRTPMQWSPDRNAGFSRADPQRLYLPPIMDSEYGYLSVNVEAQLRSPSSLLNWTRRLIAMRTAHRAFGRGGLTWLRPGNRKVFAYLREYGDEILLCVVNLSRHPQAVVLDLARFEKYVPVEISGSVVFPPIQAAPYMITLTGYGYYAFRLATDAGVPAWHEERLPQSDFPVLVLTDGWRTLFGTADSGRDAMSAVAARTREQFRSEALLPYLMTKRWYTGKVHRVRGMEFTEAGEWSTPDGSWLLSFLQVEYADAAPQSYFLPLGFAWDETAQDHIATLGAWTLARVRQRQRTGMLFGAFGHPAFCRALVLAMGRQATVPIGQGALSFTATKAYAGVEEYLQQEMRHLSLEQPHTGVFFGTKLYLKGYRQLRAGIDPELEVGRFLTERSAFSHIAPMLGSLEYIAADGRRYALAILQLFVSNQGNAWDNTTSYIERFLVEQVTVAETVDAAATQSSHAYYLEFCTTLGRRIAELHHAFAQHTGDPAFDPEPVRSEEVDSWRMSVLLNLDATIGMLRQQQAALPPSAAALIPAALGFEAALHANLSGLSLATGGIVKTRYHGALQLSRALLTGNDFVITDFEGDAAYHSKDERRAKHCPLRDVAAVLSGFSYAAGVVFERIASQYAAQHDQMSAALESWHAAAEQALLGGYWIGAEGLPSVPTSRDAANALLYLFICDRALYEIRYELEHRPERVIFPLRRLLAIVQRI